MWIMRKLIPILCYSDYMNWTGNTEKPCVPFIRTKSEDVRAWSHMLDHSPLPFFRSVSIVDSIFHTNISMRIIWLIQCDVRRTQVNVVGNKHLQTKIHSYMIAQHKLSYACFEIFLALNSRSLFHLCLINSRYSSKRSSHRNSKHKKEKERKRDIKEIMTSNFLQIFFYKLNMVSNSFFNDITNSIFFL